MVEEFVLDNIRERTDIIDVIGRYVQLKKRGQNFLGLCPFHQEKTPSFTVSPTKNIFHCFGCGTGGNVFNFLMRIENISFFDAVRQLAEQANVELPESKLNFPDRGQEKKQGYGFLKKVGEGYQQALQEAPKVLEYARKRGIAPQLIDQFQLGYALYPKLTGYGDIKDDPDTQRLAVETGVGIGPDAPFKDRFHQRFIFPIIDLQNRVVGFGGRALGDQQPKYVNSAESNYYSKGRILYNLQQAKRHLSKYDDSLIVVEGYMDVIALAKAGLPHAVAVLGTSLTEDQVKLLVRFAQTVILCFDQDEAGRKATLRAIKLFRGFEVDIKVVEFEDAKDPDEYLEKKGSDALVNAVSKAIPGLRFVIQERLRQAGEPADIAKLPIESRSRIIKDLSEEFKDVEDVIKQEYVRYIAQVLKVDVDMVKARFFSFNVFSVGKKRFAYASKREDKYTALEKDVLAVLLQMDETKRTSLLTEVPQDLFEQVELRKLHRFIQAHPDRSVAELCERVEPDLGTMLTDLSMRPVPPEAEPFIQDACGRLSKRGRERRIQTLKNEIKELEKTGNFDKLKELSKELSELIRLK